MTRPREIAPELLQRAADLQAAGDPSTIALLYGREDHGLPNWALDLAHRTGTIPTTEHKSLNLAQAVMGMAYELFLADETSQREFKQPRRDSVPATVELLEKMFEDLERALWTIDFFKSRQTEGVMRTLRGIIHRAELDAREASFLRAVAIEVRKYFERTKTE